MGDIITSTQTIESRDVVEFLNDMRQNSVTTILEGKEAKELIEIAKKRGIILKDNSDLAGFKNVYALTDKANKNRCRLPYDVVEKNLASLNGKPIDIDHIRKYVVGHHLQGKLENKKIINYGIFYKSNFGDEYKEAKKLFKAGKLTTSFEIHCPEEDRDYHEDGTYSLRKMEFAGSGILFKTKPAEPEAKVLELAKKRMDDTNSIATDLIFASEDLLVAGIEENKFEKEIDEAALPKEVTTCVKKKIKEGKKATDAVKQCWIEYKKKTIASVDNLLYKIEDGEEANKKDMEELEFSLNVFDIDLVYRMVSGLYCPKCKEDEKTGYLYLIGTDYEKKKAYLRCDTCKSKYSINLVMKPKLVKGTEIVEGEIVVDVEDLGKFEKDLISAVEGEMEEAARLTYEQRKALPDSSFAVVVTVKKKRGEGTRKIRMFPINDAAHVRNALARLGQPKPKATLKSLGVKLDDVYRKVLKKAKALGLDDLLRRNETLCKRLGIGVPKTKVNIGKGGNKTVDEKTKKELVEKAKKLGLPEDATKEKEIKEVAEKDKDKKIIELETKIAALDKALKEKKVDVEKIKADAVKVAKLKEELGKYAKDVKDEDLLDDKKVEALKVKKENDELKTKVGKLEEKIEKAGIKDEDASGHSESASDESLETARIDNIAYGTKKKKKE